MSIIYKFYSMAIRDLKFRIEHDSLGDIKVPEGAYYGAQTQRALDNFPISGLLPHIGYVCATVYIKKAAAQVNSHLGSLDKKKSQAIVSACDEILSGKLADQFVVDPYQAGAGTSHHMNVNEVIANRANQILGAPLGSYKYIHPNDHVNMSQSTNDVIPAAIRISSLILLPKLIKSLKNTGDHFSQKADEFSSILKTGRTHLQDALPITLGQEFSAYSKAINNDRKRIEHAGRNLLMIGVGGTGVGTGINTHPEYHQLMIQELSKLTKLNLKSSGNLFESMQNTADLLDLSSSLRILAGNLTRIGNDLRLLSSGPNTGFSEITLPPVQPGSSIMPGKVNPSIIEMLTMVCYQIMGLDQAILLASSAGQLELNVMLPLIAFNLLEQIKLLTNAINIFNNKCLVGIKANKKMCQFWFEKSSGIAAVLNPYLRYEKTAVLVQLALKTNKSIKELAVNKGYLTKNQADKIFSLKSLTKPNLSQNE